MQNEVKPWEFEVGSRDMFFGLVGHEYRPQPETRLRTIRFERRLLAHKVAYFLQLKRGETVLELGSGCGFVSKAIAKRVFQIHCCDISDTYLEFAKRECKGVSNIAFHKIDRLSVSLEFLSPDSIDAVFATFVFIHLNLFDIQIYLNEISKIIKPGGRVYLDIADADQLESKGLQAFEQMAKYYRQDPTNSAQLLCWNSPKAVEAIANAQGFKVRSAKSSGMRKEFVFEFKNG